MDAIHRIESSFDCLGGSFEGRLRTGNPVCGIHCIDGRLHSVHRGMDSMFSNREGSDIRLEIMDNKVFIWNGFDSFYNTHLGTVCNFRDNVTCLLGNSTGNVPDIRHLHWKSARKVDGRQGAKP